LSDALGVNLRQLEYFVVIAQEGSFTRASERLHDYPWRRKPPRATLLS
jgi:hypothetical protein